MSRLNIDSNGYRFWHIADHGRDTLWQHMNEAQKIAVTLMEKWGWTLYRLDDDKFRQAYVFKTGEMNTVINRN